MLDVENRTQIPNVSPPGVLKSILRVSVINVGEVTCWAVAPGLPSLSILSQQMLFLIPSESQDTLTYPLDPLLSSSLCAFCVIRQLTSYVYFSFLSFFFKSPSTKNCVYFCPLTPTEIFLLKIQNDCAFISFSASQNIKIPAAQ